MTVPKSNSKSVLSSSQKLPGSAKKCEVTQSVERLIGRLDRIANDVERVIGNIEALFPELVPTDGEEATDGDTEEEDSNDELEES